MSSSETKHAGINLDQRGDRSAERTETALFGFWVFLMSDAVLFALLFATYGVMLGGTAGGTGPGDLFELRAAAIETGLLLVSSFTFGLAALAMKYDAGNGRLELWLSVTLLLGVIFMGFELHDFAKMMGQGAGPSRSGFLSAFFALVSTHGLHVWAGCVWIVVLLVQLRVFGLTSAVKTRILRLGLFWHFLDIIWIGIFSVVYLQGLLR